METMAEARRAGTPTIGPAKLSGKLLTEVARTVLQAVLDAEMADHLRN